MGGMSTDVEFSGEGDPLGPAPPMDLTNSNYEVEMEIELSHNQVGASMNPTGIITYMTVEEARANGLIEDEESHTEGGIYGVDEGMSFLPYPEDTDTQVYQDTSYELDTEGLVNSMFNNPFAPFSKGITSIVQDSGRTIIPIRKLAGGSAASKAAVVGTEHDVAHPFVCDLCSEKFKKKLFLNNHMESRHGIKFVFTEKGKKVKLVRMPTQVMEGEKLDPCVRLLIDSNGNNSGNIIGVQPVETVGELNMQSRNPTAHEVDPYDILQGKAAVDKDFGCAILVETIRTFAMKAAKERGQTPFVAYRPYRSKKLYLLSITPFSKKVQLLMPANEEDLENAEGIMKEPSYYYTEKKGGKPDVKKEQEGQGREAETEGPGPSAGMIRNPTTKFSHIPIVLYVEQAMNEARELVCNYYARPVTEPVSLMKFDDFARTMIKSRSKPKRLRCLSMPAQPAAASCTTEPIVVPKRKYTRRSFGRRSSAFVRANMDLVSSTENESKNIEETKSNEANDCRQTLAMKRKRGDDDDAEISDDEEADATYVPYRETGAGSGKRGRGRPRKSSL